MAGVITLGFFDEYMSSATCRPSRSTTRLTRVWNSVSPGCGEVKAAPRKQVCMSSIVPSVSRSSPCQCTYSSSRFQPKLTLIFVRIVPSPGAAARCGAFSRAMHCPFLMRST